jgi:hypothetical protein
VSAPKFALFRGVIPGVNKGQQFFSINHPEEDQTKLLDGTVAYEIIGYADTEEEAQQKLGLRPNDILWWMAEYAKERQEADRLRDLIRRTAVFTRYGLNYACGATEADQPDSERRVTLLAELSKVAK